MATKTITDRGGNPDTTTGKRDFEQGTGARPGRKSPDPGHLDQKRQSGSGRKPPEGQEKARPRDTGRSGA